MHDEYPTYCFSPNCSRRQVLRGTACGLTAGALGGPMGLAHGKPLRSTEQAQVFPSVAHRLRNGRLGVRVEAWVFQRERQPIRRFMLAKGLGLDWEDWSASDRKRFEARTALFGAEGKAGRVLALRWPGAAAQPLAPSDDDGRVRAVVEHSGPVAPGGWIKCLLEAGGRQMEGRALWPGEQGLSIVSDIDDTIKVTQMLDKQQMLLNTFVREFVAAPGMAAWYQKIAAAAPKPGGVAFHYLSGGPLQMQPALAPFFDRHQFPAGSLHLRAFSMRPDALLDKAATARHKLAELEQLLADHPRRRFVLIGDSGEKDPETYGTLARAHPHRVAAILIRDVSHLPSDAARFASAFGGLNAALWQVFDEPAGLPVRWT